MSTSKIKLKVQHSKHQKQQKSKPKQQKQKPKQQKQKLKQQKSGQKLGKSKDKQTKKSIKQQSQPQQDTKLQKSKSKDKDKKKNKKQQQQKSPSKKDKKDKQDKKDKKDKKAQKQQSKQDKKDKKDKKKKQQKQDKKDKDKKKDKKDKKDKKGKKGKQSSDQQVQDIKSKSKLKKIDKDKQLQTIGNIGKEQNKAKLTIGELIQSYKQVSYDIFVNHGHNPQKEKQIQKQLQRLQKQKQRRQQKLQELNKQAEQRRLQKQRKAQQRKKRKQQKQLQKRKKSIQQKLENLSQQAKKRKQQHIKFIQYSQERKKNHIPRYKKYQQQYKQFQQAIKQQQDQILQQRKLKAAPIDYQQLGKFHQQYQQQKLQTLQHSQRKIRLQQQILSQQNQWMKSLFKGKTHKNLESKINQNVIEQQLKTAKEKLIRTKQYGKLIKSQFIQHKEEEQQKTQRRTYNDSDQIKFSEKFVKGKSLGLVPENRVKPLPHDQKQKLGVQYLEYIRKLPRKGINSSSLPKTIDVNSSRVSQKVGKTYILKRPTNPYYNIQKNGSSFDAKNHKQIQVTIQLIKSKDHTTALQERALHYLQYSDVVDLQKKHSNVNKRLVNDINNKLDVLKKLVN